MVAIDFKLRRGGKSGGRMLVGFRRRDWTPVWYEPIPGSEDDEGGAETGYYCFANGESTYRAPMKGEIVWVPQFDPAEHESSNTKEKTEMHKQTLKDAHDYAVETDKEKLKEMEQKFDNPRFPRQYSWFSELRKWKKNSQKQRGMTRNKREAFARDIGENPATCEINSDDSDSDSGYEDAFRAKVPPHESEARPKKKRGRKLSAGEDQTQPSDRRRKPRTDPFNVYAGEHRRRVSRSLGRTESVSLDRENALFVDGEDFDSSPPDTHDQITSTFHNHSARTNSLLANTQNANANGDGTANNQQNSQDAQQNADSNGQDTANGEHIHPTVENGEESETRDNVAGS